MKWNIIIIIYLLATTAAADVIIGNNILWGNNVLLGHTPSTIEILTPTGNPTYGTPILITINATSTLKDTTWYTIQNQQYTYTTPTNQPITLNPYVNGINITLTAYVNDTYRETYNTTLYWIAYIPPLNNSNTETMNDIIQGKPFQAAQKAQENISGDFFFAFIISAVFFGIWLRTGNLTFSVIVLDLLWFVLKNHLHQEIHYLVYGMNIFVFGLFFYRIIRRNP